MLWVSGGVLCWLRVLVSEVRVSPWAAPLLRLAGALRTLPGAWPLVFFCGSAATLRGEPRHYTIVPYSMRSLGGSVAHFISAGHGVCMHSFWCIDWIFCVLLAPLLLPPAQRVPHNQG